MAQLEESKALDLSGLEHYNQKLNDEKIGNIKNLGGGKTDLGGEASAGVMDITGNIKLTNSGSDDAYCRISCGQYGKVTFDVITGTNDIYTAYLSPNPGGDIAMKNDLEGYATKDYVDNKTWDATDITSGTLSTTRIPNLSTTKITSGIFPISRGGTGRSSSPSMLVNLASTSAATVLSATPRPGVTGVLPAAHGGTGVNNLKDLIKFTYTPSTKTLNITVDTSLFGD